MENEYVKLWVSYEAYFEPLGDAEVGRLARAMIEYKSSGAAPKFSGNERFVWPAIKRDIDNAIAAQQGLSQTRADSGKLGGRPKKPNAFSEKQKNQMVFEESKKSYGKGQGQGNGQGKGQGNIDFSPSGEKTRARFTPPTVEEVEAYIRERKSNVNARRFVDFYASKGWMVGKNPMKDWRAAIRTWEQRDGTQTQEVASSAPDAGELERMKKMREKLRAGTL